MAKTSCVCRVCKPAAKSRLRFQYGKRTTGWYWHIKARNGEIIAQGEGYARKRDALHVWSILVADAGTMELMERKITGIG